jgi:hypothetical protein
MVGGRVSNTILQAFDLLGSPGVNYRPLPLASRIGWIVGSTPRILRQGGADTRPRHCHQREAAGCRRWGARRGKGRRCMQP